jgi:hypothetical protein
MIPTIKLSSPALHLRNEMILAYESRKEIFQFGAVVSYFFSIKILILLIYNLMRKFCTKKKLAL